MAIKFTTTASSGETVNVLVYGRAGTGKTVLASTAPKPIIISSEKGLMSISEFDIPVIEVSNLDDLKEAYDYVLTHQKKFKTVVLDSISDIAETVLASLLAVNKDPRKAYGLLNSEMATQIRKFRDLDMSTYFIAKAETYENASGLQCMRPSMPGKTLTKDLPYFFDILLVLRLGEREIEGKNEPFRYLQSEPDLTYEAKNRCKRVLPVEKPDLKQLFKKIKG